MDRCSWNNEKLSSEADLLSFADRARAARWRERAFEEIDTQRWEGYSATAVKAFLDTARTDPIAFRWIYRKPDQRVAGLKLQEVYDTHSPAGWLHAKAKVHR